MNRRLIFSLATAFGIAACSETPTSNTEVPGPELILHSSPDAGEHPYVGMLVFYDAVEEGWFRCSGALLNATTVLTAGHCTFDVGTNGEVTQGGSGGSDTWVTFNENVDLTAFREALNNGDLADQRAALNNDNNFIRGTSFPSPEFVGFPGANFPNTSDVGVVKLNAAAPVHEYAALAPLNAITGLAKHVIFDIVGYGLQDTKPLEQDLRRTKGQAQLISLKSAVSGGVNLQLSNNNGTPHSGGICSGDSGGPVILDDVVYAVHSFGRTGCKGFGYSYRVDIDPVHAWILSKL